MAERGVLALCLQAPGETAAAVACAALASALAVILTATSALTPPPPSPASAYPRGRPSSLWLASGYHQGAGSDFNPPAAAPPALLLATHPLMCICHIQVVIYFTISVA